MTVEDWAEIRRLQAQEQLSIRAIAKHLGIARDTVPKAVNSPTLPRYVRPKGPSAFDAYEPPVRELLKDFPTMPVTVIAERVGWDGSPSWFRKQVAGLRVDYAPRDPADRLEHRPGSHLNRSAGGDMHRQHERRGGVDAIFDFLVRDFSSAAVALHTKLPRPRSSRSVAMGAIGKPVPQPELSERVWHALARVTGVHAGRLRLLK